MTNPKNHNYISALFNGNAYIGIDELTNAGESFTVQAWTYLKPNPASTRYTIFAIGDDYGNPGIKIWIEKMGKTNKARVLCGSGDVLTSNTRISPGRWFNIAVTFHN